MAQPNRGRRPRGRNNNQNRQRFINKNQAFDSSGPQGRVRGNAQQIYEKYQALARDAQAANEHTLAEAHFQHAEHYLRLYSDMLEQIEAQRAEKAKRDEERMTGRNDSANDGASDSANDTANDGMNDNPEEVRSKPRNTKSSAVDVPPEADVVAEPDLSAAPQPDLITPIEKVVEETAA